jgi:hypothetical protein
MIKTVGMRRWAVSVAILATVAGCATSTKVAIQQPGDQAMSCEALRGEFTKLDTVAAEADSNKGVNTANVAAVLFFWPAAVGNYMDADKAQKLVEQRRAHLMTIYNSKSCDAPIQATQSQPAPAQP